jgi:hypothetical protein
VTLFVWDAGNEVWLRARVTRQAKLLKTLVH